MPVVSDYTAILSEYTWSGYQDGGPAFVSYSFETVVQPYLDTNNFSQGFLDSFVAFNSAERTAARAALAQWADASGLVLLEVGAGQGDIRLGSYDFSLDPNTNGFAGYGYFPYTDITEFDAYRDGLGGDVFFDLGSGTDTYLLLHEIGHALGFQHPFDSDPTLPPELDNHTNTVMSYTGDYPGVLGVFDLQAVAAVYGGPGSDGNQVASWSWNAATQTLLQTGFGSSDTIFGIGGRDIIDGADGNDRIGGFHGDDSLGGGAGDDALFGAEGNDTLNGGTGNDTLDGGAGNDLFIVNNQGDIVTEYASGGNDRLATSVSYVLDAFAYIERMYTTALAGIGAIALTGNALTQSITGNAGANVLSDGGGAGDTLTGMAGNDTYIIRSAASQIIETAGGGTADKVATAISYALGSASAVEIITTTSASGTTALTLTGNALAQSITGNAGANYLSTGGGAADRLTGLGGNDTYRVYNAADLIIETAGGGSADRVTTSVSFALAADDDIELITTNGSTGTTAITLTGNALAQRIFGNAGANVLNGKGGADTLTGGAGADSFVFDTGFEAERITDYSVADDTIVLENAIFTALTATGTLSLAAFAANTTGLAADSADRIIYDSGTGLLWYDADGLGGTAGISFARLSAGLGLLHSDFTVI